MRPQLEESVRGRYAEPLKDSDVIGFYVENGREGQRPERQDEQ